MKVEWHQPRELHSLHVSPPRAARPKGGVRWRVDADATRSRRAERGTLVNVRGLLTEWHYWPGPIQFPTPSGADFW